jgi:hypothetical protein
MSEKTRAEDRLYFFLCAGEKDRNAGTEEFSCYKKE